MPYFIGIDIGGMSIKGGVCNERGEIIFKHILATKVYDQHNSITADIAIVIDNLIAQSKGLVDYFDGVGIGSPGSIDSQRGVIRYSNNIKMQDVKVFDQLREIYKDRRDVLRGDFFINNDANCAGLGEHLFGSGKGYKNSIFITLGTGVGSGFILNGVLFEGELGAGTEAGHTVIRHKGNPCNCGRYGCWETYASATALMRQTATAMEKHPESLMHEIAKKEGKISGKTAFRAADLGDKPARAVVRQYISYISEGVINLANIFSPDAIIIGGGISYEGEKLTRPLQKATDKLLYGASFNKKPKILTASLTNDAGIIGAVSLAIAAYTNFIDSQSI